MRREWRLKFHRSLQGTPSLMHVVRRRLRPAPLHRSAPHARCEPPPGRFFFGLPFGGLGVDPALAGAALFLFGGLALFPTLAGLALGTLGSDGPFSASGFRPRPDSPALGVGDLL